MNQIGFNGILVPCGDVKDIALDDFIARARQYGVTCSAEQIEDAYNYLTKKQED